MLAIKPITILKPVVKLKRKVKSFAVKNVDPYRETSLRYMGYANDLGESFTQYLPDWGVPASYCVSASYVFFDTIDKGQKAYENSKKEDRFKETFRASAETLAWQLMASILWPGSLIRIITNMSATFLHMNHLDENNFSHFLPTFCGIAAIPHIVKPIDETVDKIVKKSVSKILNGEIKNHNDIKYVFYNIVSGISLPPVICLLVTFIKKIKM